MSGNTDMSVPPGGSSYTSVRSRSVSMLKQPWCYYRAPKILVLISLFTLVFLQAGSPQAATLYFGEMKSGRVTFLSDKAYKPGDKLWAYLGQGAKTPLSVLESKPYPGPDTCGLQQYYAIDARGAFNKTASNVRLEHVVSLRGDREPTSGEGVVLVSPEGLDVSKGKIIITDNLDPVLEKPVAAIFDERLVEYAADRVKVKDAVAQRQSYFPLKAVDQRILDEGPKFLQKFLAAKTFATSKGQIVQVIAKWKDNKKTVAVLSGDFLIKDTNVVFFKIDNSVFHRMTMPEFRGWDWDQFGYEFYSNVFDLSADGVFELIKRGSGYESRWISLFGLNFDTQRIELLSAQGCGL